MTSHGHPYLSTLRPGLPFLTPKAVILHFWEMSLAAHVTSLQKGLSGPLSLPRRCDKERDQLGAPGHPAQRCAQSAQPHHLRDLGPGLTMGRRQSLGHEHIWFLTKGHSKPECSQKRNATVNRRHWVVCQEVLLHWEQECCPQAPCPVKEPRV